MAEHLNISLQFYSQIERGVNRLSYKNALKIAEYLNCSTDELFKEDFKGAELQLRFVLYLARGKRC